MKMMKLKNARKLKRPFSFTFTSDRSRSKSKDKDIVELEAEAKAEEEAADTVDAEHRAAFLIGQLELAEVPQNAHGLGTISVVVEEEEEDLEDEEDDDDDGVVSAGGGSGGGGVSSDNQRASPSPTTSSSTKAPFTSRKRSRSFTVSRASRRSWSLLRNTFAGGSEQSTDGRSTSSPRDVNSSSSSATPAATTAANSTATPAAARRPLGASRVGQRAASVDDVGGFREAAKPSNSDHHVHGDSHGNSDSPGRRLLSLFQGALEQGSRGASLKRRGASAERSTNSSSRGASRGSTSMERGSSAERRAKRQPAGGGGSGSEAVADSPKSDSDYSSGFGGSSANNRDLPSPSSASGSQMSTESPISPPHPQPPSSSTSPSSSSEGGVAALVSRETEAQAAAAAAAAWREARREHETELAALRARAAELEAQEEKRKEELRRLHESEQAAVSEVVYLKSENFELEKSVQLLKRSALKVVPPINPVSPPASPAPASHQRRSASPAASARVDQPAPEAPAGTWPSAMRLLEALKARVLDVRYPSDAPSLRNMIAAALVAGLALSAGGAFRSVPSRRNAPTVATTTSSLDRSSRSSSSHSHSNSAFTENFKTRSGNGINVGSSSDGNSLSRRVSNADSSAAATEGGTAAASLLAHFRNYLHVKTGARAAVGGGGGTGAVDLHSGEWLETADRSLSLFLGDDGQLRVLKGLPWADDSETLWQSPAPKDKGGQFVVTREYEAGGGRSGGRSSNVGSLVVWQMKRFQKPKEIWRSGFDSASSSTSSSGTFLPELLALRPWLLPDETPSSSSWTLRAVASAISGGPSTSLAAKAEASLRSGSAAMAGRGALREGNLVLDLKDSRARARALERLQLFTRAPASPS